jgi:hypothetical protein
VETEARAVPIDTALLGSTGILCLTSVSPLMWRQGDIPEDQVDSMGAENTRTVRQCCHGSQES